MSNPQGRVLDASCLARHPTIVDRRQAPVIDACTRRTALPRGPRSSPRAGARRGDQMQPPAARTRLATKDTRGVRNTRGKHDGDEHPPAPWCGRKTDKTHAGGAAGEYPGRRRRRPGGRDQLVASGARCSAETPFAAVADWPTRATWSRPGLPDGPPVGCAVWAGVDASRDDRRRSAPTGVICHGPRPEPAQSPPRRAAARRPRQSRACQFERRGAMAWRTQLGAVQLAASDLPPVRGGS